MATNLTTDNIKTLHDMTSGIPAGSDELLYWDAVNSTHKKAVLSTSMGTALANNLNWGMTANTAGLTALTTDVITTLTHVGDFAVFAATAQNVPDANAYYISCVGGGYSVIGARYFAFRTGGYVFFGYIATAGTITWVAYHNTVGDLVFTMVNDTVFATRRLLQLTGQVITIATYPVLCDAVYCGDSINATADCFYKTSDAGGTTRSTSGTYMVLADARGLAIVGEGSNAKIFAANGSAYSGGSRTLRYLQDQFQGHWHDLYIDATKVGAQISDATSGISWHSITPGSFANQITAKNLVTDGTNGSPRAGAYTRTPELGARICIRY
jgi:hypothetical protein